MAKPELLRKDLIYPELSYEIIGCAYEVIDELGGGHHEKYYQRAMAEAYKSRMISFKEQVYYPLTFKGKVIGRQYFDFLIEDKIIVEIKKDNRFSRKHIEQVLSYLHTSNLQLAILINFTNTGIVYKRIINSPDFRL